MSARPVHIGIVGDYNPRNETHRLTDAAFAGLGPSLRCTWIPTEAVPDSAGLLAFDGLLIAPASPYRDFDGALRAIRTARERGLPLLGT